MNEMQRFYDRLVTGEPENDRYLESLVRLTEAGPDQLDALDNGRSWNDWSTNSA